MADFALCLRELSKCIVASVGRRRPADRLLAMLQYTSIHSQFVVELGCSSSSSMTQRHYGTSPLSRPHQTTDLQLIDRACQRLVRPHQGRGRGSRPVVKRSLAFPSVTPGRPPNMTRPLVGPALANSTRRLTNSPSYSHSLVCKHPPSSVHHNKSCPEFHCRVLPPGISISLLVYSF